MYCFRTAEEVMKAGGEYHATTDLDIFIDSLGDDTKVVMSATFIRRILQLPEGDKLLLAALRVQTAQTAKELHEAAVKLSDDQRIIVNFICERIGVFGPQPEGE